MSTETPLPAPSFAVSYQTLYAYNRDLAGRGTFTVRSDGFVFAGRQRGLVFNGPEHEVVLRADQIDGARQSGRCVEFTTSFGKSGEKNAPFLVVCATVENATAMLALLPTTQDEAFREAQSFGFKLQALSSRDSDALSVTNVIIALNVAAYVAMGFAGAGWLEPASMKPYILWVANNGAATTDGEWWRLVTSMFVHYGILHLALNMWALFQVGRLVEKLLGRGLFALMYLGSGVVGSISTLLWHGDKMWSAGASGAVFGVYGALLGYLWREKHGVPKSVLQPLMKSTLTFAGYNLFFGAIHPQIDNVAHVGGLVGGVLFGWLFALPLDREVRAQATGRRFLLGVAALAGAFALCVAAAPKYNYRVKDELAFEEVISPQGVREKTLLEEGSKLFNDAKTRNNDAAIALWLRQQALPFYDAWRKQAADLVLTPDLLTARRRDAFVHVLDLKLASYRGLLEGIDHGRAGAGEQYAREQKEIAAAIRAMETLK